MEHSFESRLFSTGSSDAVTAPIEGEGKQEEDDEDAVEGEGDEEEEEGGGGEGVVESKRQMKKRKRLEKQLSLMPKSDKDKPQKVSGRCLVRRRRGPEDD